MKKVIVLTILMIVMALCFTPVRAEELSGMVTRMEGNVAVTSLCRGVEPGMILYVYRQARYIGRAEVSDVGSCNSAILALPECRGLAVGDAVLSRPACEVSRPLPPFGKNVAHGFVLKETDGRSVVVGKLDLSDLEKVRARHNYGRIIVQVENMQSAEEFFIIPSRSGNLFLELQPGTYMIKNVHIAEISGVRYNAWGILPGIIPGFMMKHGGMVFPAHYSFVVSGKEPAEYIGTLRYSVNPEAPWTSAYKELPSFTAVSDEYEAAMAEFGMLNPFIRKASGLADRHMEIKAAKSLMTFVPGGPGALFMNRGEKDQAFKEYWDCLRYRDASYRAEGHYGLGGLYWDRQDWDNALIHYHYASKLGYPVPQERLAFLSQFKRLTRPNIDDW